MIGIGIDQRVIDVLGTAGDPEGECPPRAGQSAGLGDDVYYRLAIDVDQDRGRRVGDQPPGPIAKVVRIAVVRGQQTDDLGHVHAAEVDDAPVRAVSRRLADDFVTKGHLPISQKEHVLQNLFGAIHDGRIELKSPRDEARATLTAGLDKTHLKAS